MNTKIQVIVASKNPVKLKATSKGFSSFFEGFEIKGVEEDSGVSDQPMSDEETLLGARNRVALAKLNYPQADFWVGIEGGVERDSVGLIAFAWIVISDGKLVGESRTSTFRLPPEVSRLIAEGYELGHANDIIFTQQNSKQKTGAVGLLTNNRIDRTKLYVQEAQLALIPFLNREMYETISR